MSKVELGRCANEADSIDAWMKAVEGAVAPEDIHKISARILDPTLRKSASPAEVATAFTLNGMLSGLGTPVANVLGIAFKAVQEPFNDIIEKAVLSGKPLEGMGEVMSGYRAMLNSFQLALSLGKEGWTKAYPLDFNAALASLAKGMDINSKEVRQLLVDELLNYRATLYANKTGKSYDEARQQIIDSGYLSTKAEQDQEMQVFLNEGYDYMRNAFRGKLSGLRWMNIPTKATVAIDEFGKSLFRQYRIGQMAYKKALDDKKLDRTLNVNAQADKYIKDVNKGIIEGDSTSTFRNLQRDVNEVFGSGKDMQPYTSIKEYAQRQMFQQRLTGIPAEFHELLQNVPALRMFIPFMKTPWNITKEGFSYLPLIAPLMKYGYPEASKALHKMVGAEYKESMKNLGAYYELSGKQLLARQVVGLGYFGGIMTMMDSDLITGKPRNAQENQQWKDQGIPEQSIRVGDEWVSYARIEPVATVMGLAAELRRAYEDYVNPPAGEEPNDQILKGTMLALKANIMDKSFVDGFNQLFNGLTNPETSAQTLALAVTKPFTPAIMNQAARILDPHERQATTVGEKLQQRVPFLREDLPVEYGLYGGERGGKGTGPFGSTMQEWTGINAQSAIVSPVQRAFEETGATPIRSNAKLKGVGLNNEQIAEYRKRVNEYITPRLEALVNGGMFKNMKKSGQRKVLEQAVSKLKRGVTTQYALQLAKTDPVMAAKFREVELFSRGLEDYVDQ